MGTAKEYLDNVVNALRVNPHAQDFYKGKNGALRQGRDVVRALKGAKGSVEFLGCVVGVTRLRQYFRVLSKDILIVRQGENSLTVEQDHHKTTFRHGAWDKYAGENGYHARLTFKGER